MDSSPVRVGVIMAGGSGERFWPLSRASRPKQLLRLASTEASMLEEAVARLANVVEPEKVYVVTGRHLQQPIRDGQTMLPPENVLAEPCKRNTSGALAWAAAHALALYGDPANITMAVTTADHRIGDDARFTQVASRAVQAAETHGALATIGVAPTRPETGYGYIQIAGHELPLEGGHEDVPVYAVRDFHEKPSLEKAEDFVAEGTYFWNSGMFFWRLDAFLAELEEARPSLSAAVEAMALALRDGDEAAAARVFETLEDISIDYALMEHARNVVLVRADFPWDDVGAWPALDRTMPRDDAGNVLVGDPVALDCEGCIVYNDAGPEAVAVSVIGMKDVAVVVTKDAVLVVPKDRAQDVRHAVRALKDRGSPQV